MFSWFKRRQSNDLTVDIHSHLIPGIDDGVKNLGEALLILEEFEKIGVRKVVTTPHVHPDYYPNTRKEILLGLDSVNLALQKSQLKIKLEAAAEYFIDGSFLDLLNDPEEILSFGGARYVLVETPFMNKPLIFDEVIFKMKSLGFTPVLAHPERYSFISEDLSWIKKVRDQGVLLQITSSSLLGVYGKEAQKTAKKLLKEQMVDFVGSDVHRIKQMPMVVKSFKQNFPNQNLRNNELI
ncbi:MAG: CpsB/CapC family capsule biosynthesis tyrosine phosphatase [Marinoscillum sp.]